MTDRSNGMGLAAVTPLRETTMTFPIPVLRRAAGVVAVAVLFGATPAAFAHHVNASKSATTTLREGAPLVIEGQLSILEFVHGSGYERIYALVASDGTATRLAFNQSADGLRQGMRLAVTGHASRGALVVESQRAVGQRSIAAAPTPTTVEGTMHLLHADYFEGGQSRFIWTLQQDNGDQREVDFAIPPTDLESGMRVSV